MKILFNDTEQPQKLNFPILAKLKNSNLVVCFPDNENEAFVVVPADGFSLFQGEQKDGTDFAPVTHSDIWEILPPGTEVRFVQT